VGDDQRYGHRDRFAGLQQMIDSVTDHAVNSGR